MSEIIAFLESAGRNSALDANSEGYARMVNGLAIEAPQRRALLQRDVAGLRRETVGARQDMLCVVTTPEDEQLQEYAAGRAACS